MSQKLYGYLFSVSLLVSGASFTTSSRQAPETHSNWNTHVGDHMHSVSVSPTPPELYTEAAVASELSLVVGFAFLFISMFALLKLDGYTE